MVHTVPIEPEASIKKITLEYKKKSIISKAEYTKAQQLNKTEHKYPIRILPVLDAAVGMAATAHCIYDLLTLHLPHPIHGQGAQYGHPINCSEIRISHFFVVVHTRI